MFFLDWIIFLNEITFVELKKLNIKQMGVYFRYNLKAFKL